MNYLEIRKRYALAQKHGFAMGAFNFCSSDIARGIYASAIKLHAPIIMATSSGEMHHLGAHVARGIVDGLDKEFSGVAILHLDHGKTFEDIKTAVDAGYDSVHCDGSALSYEENIRLTRKAVKYAHKHAKWIEGELGHVGGSSTLHKKSYKDVKMVMTDPAQAADFVRRTGVNSLAVNIGNVHGVWKGRPRIDFDLLKEIHKRVHIPLVLHGGSGIAPEQIRKALTLGILKVNVNSEMRIEFSARLRKALKDPKMFVPTKYLPKGIAGVSNVVDNKIRLFRSADKLRKL